ncbi:anti-sigma factor family protein [Nonomuraea angiospora]|uniref:Anti-sigma factor RsiW n=1 Tax=Nonomuraea angiospora TaxID=46172 RepID=A0ABR9M7K7_9ACTN|nr:zf-HC2 domain-containing protein [Nonomuraea angiospora]MBE1588887.1 anti-sigma factor RsiW [Nonomuraea angiospora]
MTGDTHYDLEILAELAEGLLDVDTARRVREHLAVCDPCGELLADLAAVREVLAATPTPAMPMGVALRIDKALAAEAESRRGGIGLVEAPDWDELMRDAPWERPVEVAAEAVPEPVRLGVVSDDGTIVPARASRRRRWAMPAIAAAAAVAVVGTAVASTGLLASGGGRGGSIDVVADGVTKTSVVPSTPAKVPTMARSYGLTDSGHNYSDQDLRQPLEGMFGFQRMVGGGSDDDGKVDKCVKRVSSRSRLPAYQVDQGQYNGQEALIVASWKDKASQRLRIDIVDPFNCKNLRKPTLGRW